MARVLVTGGCGFIGSNFIKYLLASDDAIIDDDVYVVNVDKQTYAGRGKNLEHALLSYDINYRFIKADICDKSLMDFIFFSGKLDYVFNFAAESHVDRSIKSPEDFVLTNIIGTANLLDCAKKYGLERFIQVSTDEVYGSIGRGSFDETSPLYPSSPYSASKASADLLSLSYFKTHNMPVVITRSANNYGPYQYPEKLLPLFITNLIDKQKVPLMWSKKNPGLNVRDWLHVEDNCRAIWFLAKNGINGKIYNISGENERTNIEMTKMLLENFNFGEGVIEKIPHRFGHDFRYSISNKKLKSMGFHYKHLDLKKELKILCDWYIDNENWWRPLKK